MTDLTPTPDRPTQPPAVPDELLAQWINEATAEGSFEPIYSRALARRLTAWAWSQREDDVREAEQRGADAELEGCCEWLRDQGGCHGIATMLRAARRPAPPTLREQALADVLYLRGMEGALLDISGDSLHERLSRITAALQEGADG